MTTKPVSRIYTIEGGGGGALDLSVIRAVILREGHCWDMYYYTKEEYTSAEHERDPDHFLIVTDSAIGFQVKQGSVFDSFDNFPNQHAAMIALEELGVALNKYNPKFLWCNRCVILATDIRRGIKSELDNTPSSIHIDLVSSPYEYIIYYANDQLLDLNHNMKILTNQFKCYWDIYVERAMWDNKVIANYKRSQTPLSIMNPPPITKIKPPGCVVFHGRTALLNDDSPTVIRKYQAGKTELEEHKYDLPPRPLSRSVSFSTKAISLFKPK